MPVMTKDGYTRLISELNARIDALIKATESRSLRSSAEGAGRGHWRTPDMMCATKATTMELRIAVEDFKTILAEIKRLK